MDVTYLGHQDDISSRRAGDIRPFAYVAGIDSQCLKQLGTVVSHCDLILVSFPSSAVFD